MAKIIGGTATSSMPIPDWNQTNPNRADYIKNKPDIAKLEQDIADLKYVAIQITSVGNNIGTVEMGTTVSSVTITWALNKTPTSQAVEGTSVDVSARSHTISGLSLTAGKTFSVLATDERGASDVATTAFSVLNGV